MTLLGQVGAVLHLLLAGQSGYGTAQSGNATAAGGAFTSTHSTPGTIQWGSEGFGQLGRIIEALLAGATTAGNTAQKDDTAPAGADAAPSATDSPSETGNGAATALGHVSNATARSVLAAQSATTETPADAVPALDLSALADLTDLVDSSLDEAAARSLAERSVEAAHREAILQRVTAVAQGGDPGTEDTLAQARAALAALDPILGAYGAIALAAVSAGGTPTAALRQRPVLFL